MRTQVGAQTKTADIPRSSFDLSHGLKTTLNASQLVPILSLEVLPGDTVNLRASLFGRMATPQKPLLENLYMETFFFFTPWRQVWENFIKMMGEQVNPGDSIDYSIPVCSTGIVTELSLMDYFGIPLGLDCAEVPVSALPFRCYMAVYNFWFRDENLVDAFGFSTGDGPDGWASVTPLSRRKRRDYITSGLPFPQKGPDVTVNLGGNAEIFTTATLAENIVTGQDPNQILYTELDSSGASLTGFGGNVPGPANFFANLNDASGISINELRESIQIQRLLERDARAELAIRKFSGHTFKFPIRPYSFINVHCSSAAAPAKSP